MWCGIIFLLVHAKIIDGQTSMSDRLLYVKKIKLKMKHKELMLKRDIQKTEGGMVVERQKVNMVSNKGK